MLALNVAMSMLTSHGCKPCLFCIRLFVCVSVYYTLKMIVSVIPQCVSENKEQSRGCVREFSHKSMVK